MYMVYAYSYVYVHAHVYVSVPVYIYIRNCMYMYVYTYTHMHESTLVYALLNNEDQHATVTQTRSTQLLTPALLKNTLALRGQ